MSSKKKEALEEDNDKPKISKEEQLYRQMDEELDEYAEDADKFKLFITRVANWAERNVLSIQRFNRIVPVPMKYEDIQAMLIDYKVLCNEFERYIICRMLDVHKKRVIMVPLTYGTIMVGYENFLADFHLPMKDHALLGTAPIGWVEITFYMLDVGNGLEFSPYMITSVVPSDYTFYMLLLIIEKHLEPLTRSQIYASKELGQPPVPITSTLADLGYFGGTQDAPQKVVLYFNEEKGAVDCPLLFRKRTTG